MTHYVLFYEYVEGIVEKRAPFRAGHLALAEAARDRGELLLAGAWADPVDGAAFIFRVDDMARVDAFARADPYVTNGLVREWRVREWTVVIGGDQARGSSAKASASSS